MITLAALALSCATIPPASIIDAFADSPYAKRRHVVIAETPTIIEMPDHRCSTFIKMRDAETGQLRPQYDMWVEVIVKPSPNPEDTHLWVYLIPWANQA